MGEPASTRHAFPGRKSPMRISSPFPKCLAARTVTSLALLTTAAYAQDSQPTPLSSLESELQEMRAENTDIRGQLQRMEEQQKALLGLIDQLRQRLDGPVAVTNAVLTTHESP